VGFVKSGHFGGAGAHVDAAVAAVVAHAILNASAVGDVVVDDGVVVDVGDVAADVGYVAVVVEVIAVPVATEVADADVAEAVINTTVEADVRAPIAVVEAVVAAVVAPVGRCPKRAVVRGWAPCAGNPVVAAVAPAPVAGGPDVVGLGSGRLIVVRERWGRLIGNGVIAGVVGVLALIALVVIGLLDGCGGLLALIAFALLLWLIGRALTHDLGGLAGSRTGS